MSTVDRFRASAPVRGQITLMWLGQNGFLVKNSRGEVCVMDAYLSDLSERLDGNKRLMMPVVAPDEIGADLVLATHHHTDHLDLDSLPHLLRSDTRLCCCVTSARMCREAGISESVIDAVRPGDIQTYGGFRVQVVDADHGDYAPDAVGFVVTTEGVSVYLTGDTAYRQRLLRPAADLDLDILIPPINGEYGNLNERDAVSLALLAKPRLVIPSHFWTFARHQGSPYDFETAMRISAPDIPFYLMAQGEVIRYSRAEGILPA